MICVACVCRVFINLKPEKQLTNKYALHPLVCTIYEVVCVLTPLTTKHIFQWIIAIITKKIGLKLCTKQDNIIPSFACKAAIWKYEKFWIVKLCILFIKRFPNAVLIQTMTQKKKENNQCTFILQTYHEVKSNVLFSFYLRPKINSSLYRICHEHKAPRPHSLIFPFAMSWLTFTIRPEGRKKLQIELFVKQGHPLTWFRARGRPTKCGLSCGHWELIWSEWKPVNCSRFS